MSHFITSLTVTEDTIMWTLEMYDIGNVKTNCTLFSNVTQGLQEQPQYTIVYFKKT